VDQHVRERGIELAGVHQPGVGADQRAERDRDHGWGEQRAEQAGEELHAPLGNQGAAEPERQDALVPAGLGGPGGAVGTGQQAERG
jgi:hypothetical protein